MKLVFIVFFFTFYLLTNNLFGQLCNCNDFPILKEECKKKCFMDDLKTDSPNDLTTKYKVKKETATRIVNIKNRSTKKNIEDFGEDLPYNYYNDLKNSYENYISSSLTQNNTFGTNIGSQSITNNFTIADNPYSSKLNSDSIKYEITKRNIKVREQLSQFMFEGYHISTLCSTDIDTLILDKERLNWDYKVSNYLSLNLDESYTTQFNLSVVDSADLVYGGVKKENQNIHAYIMRKMRYLNKFIFDLRNNPLSQLTINKK